MADKTTARRQLLRCLLTGAAAASMPGVAGSTASRRDTESRASAPCNPLDWAVAWKQSAAEFRALCYQAFNLARLKLDLAIAGHATGDKPLAVITDMDDTILHVNDYWAKLIALNRDFFDDAIWDEWIPENRVTAVPGALEFCRYCNGRGVAVFYVTNRNQGANTRAFALGHLQHLGFPLPDEDRLIVFRETSDKSPARESIMRQFNVPFLVGDNLNDYKRDYYVADVDERLSRMERDRDDYGHRFILLPNPTDGHWVRAIFGDSEPAPTDENRRRLHGAAIGARSNP